MKKRFGEYEDAIILLVLIVLLMLVLFAVFSAIEQQLPEVWRILLGIE